MKREPEAYYEAEIFEIGIGQVLVSRFKSGGRVEVGTFLVDVYCLGVKDALFQVIDDSDFCEGFLNQVFPEGIPSPKPASWGRKLVEDAARYAGSLGIAPHPDYKKGARVFGGIDASECGEKFIFGSKGRPLYVRGPYDDEAMVQRILSVLHAKLGEGGFDYVMPEGLESDDEWEEVDVDILAMDSEGGERSPDRMLVTFAENFRNEHEGYGEIEYSGKTGARIASDMLAAARELSEKIGADTAQDISLNEAIRYMQTLWNVRALPGEDRNTFFSQVPEALAEHFQQAIAQTGESSPMGDDLILDFLLLNADVPSKERLLLLAEFF